MWGSMFFQRVCILWVFSTSYSLLLKNSFRFKPPEPHVLKNSVTAYWLGGDNPLIQEKKADTHFSIWSLFSRSLTALCTLNGLDSQYTRIIIHSCFWPLVFTWHWMFLMSRCSVTLLVAVIASCSLQPVTSDLIWHRHSGVVLIQFYYEVCC